MPSPTYRAFRRIDSSSVPANSNGDKRIKSWLWDDNLALLNTMLERIAEAAFEQGGVITPGTVTQSGNAVDVTSRMGITRDGKTAVALPDTPATSFDFSTQADGYYLLVIVPTERTVAEAFSDPSTSETITHQMLDDLGGLDVAFDAASYPSTPPNGVACAQVQVASGAITAFSQLDEAPVIRGVGSSIEQSIVVACSDETTDLATGLEKVSFRMPYGFSLSEVRASVRTAPAGAAIQVDINSGGASILSTPITIDAGEKTSVTAATPPVISSPFLADDAEITIDLDQVGSSTPGAGLKVTLIGVAA